MSCTNCIKIGLKFGVFENKTALCFNSSNPLIPVDDFDEIFSSGGDCTLLYPEDTEKGTVFLCVLSLKGSILNYFI